MWLMNCKLCANSSQSVFKLFAISEHFVCKHNHTDKNTSCCTFRLAFKAKKDMPSPVYCASVLKNQFTVQVYTKPVYCTGVHKISLMYKCTQSQLMYRCTQNQFTAQVYTKPVYGTILHIYMDNGQNITKVKAVQTMRKVCANCVQTVCLLCANCVQAVSKLFANWLALV